MVVQIKHGENGSVKTIMKKGKMKRLTPKQEIKHIRIAIFAIVGYLVISHLAFATAIYGISEQLRNIMF